MSPLWAGQQPWLHPGWKILPTRIGYCVRRFWCEDKNVAFTHVQPRYHRVRKGELCHLFDEVARHSS